VEVVEEAEQAVLHLLYVRYIGQKGVLDDGCRLALVLMKSPTQTQMMPGFDSPVKDRNNRK